MVLGNRERLYCSFRPEITHLSNLSYSFVKNRSGRQGVITKIEQKNPRVDLMIILAIKLVHQISESVMR